MAAALPGAAALPPTAVRGASLTRLLGPPAPPTPQPSADPLRFRLPPPVFSRSQNGMASPRNMNRTPSRNRIGCDSVIRPVSPASHVASLKFEWERERSCGG
ncbi:uncharacterized protein LOC144288501 isoform X2 [Canis aureus]